MKLKKVKIVHSSVLYIAYFLVCLETKLLLEKYFLCLLCMREQFLLSTNSGFFMIFVFELLATVDNDKAKRTLKRMTLLYQV